MADYLILHHKNPSYTVDPPRNGAVPVTTSHYRKVGIVIADNLAGVYDLTRHTNEDWTLNEGVNLFSKPGEKSIRSTGVGDLALNLETMTLWVCDAIGWSRAQWWHNGTTINIRPRSQIPRCHGRSIHAHLCRDPGQGPRRESDGSR